MLLEHDIDINSIDFDGNTPLHYTLNYGRDIQVDNIIRLLELGVNPTIGNKYNKKCSDISKMS